MIKNKTLEEVALNSDGKTYNGKKVLQWLFETTTNKILSDEEADKIMAEAMEKRKKRLENET